MKVTRLYVDSEAADVTASVRAKAAKARAMPVVGLVAKLLSEELGVVSPFTITEKDDEAEAGRNVIRTIDLAQ